MSEDDYEYFVKRQLEALQGSLVAEYRRQVRRSYRLSGSNLSRSQPVEAGSLSYVASPRPSKGVPRTVDEPFGAPPTLDVATKEHGYSSQGGTSSHGTSGFTEIGFRSSKKEQQAIHDELPHDDGNRDAMKVQSMDDSGEPEVSAADSTRAALGGVVDLNDRPAGVTWKKASESSQAPPKIVKSKTKKSLGGEARKSVGGESEIGTSFSFPNAPNMRATTSSHQFEVHRVWANGGANARRFYSIRSKSAFLEFKEINTKAHMESELIGGAKQFMIHPSSLTHLLWDVSGLLLIGYDCITIPMEVFDPEDNVFQDFMSWVIRLYWTFNIVMSFMTGYLHENGTVEMRPRQVARRYMCTWLPLDVFIVSFDWIEAAVEGLSGGIQRFGTSFRVLRMIRTIRLVRLVRAPEITGFVNEHIRSEQVLLSATIVKIISLVLGVAHLIACAWYAMGRFSKMGPGENSWIRRYEISDMDMGQRYAVSFHWSLSMVAGELTHEPQNGSERIFTICVLFFAIMVSTSFVSSLTTAMTQLRIITSQQSSQLAKLRRFLVDHNISRELAVRIQRNAQFSLMERAKHAPESTVELLKIISHPLMVELHFEIHSPLLMGHPFMELYHDVNPGGIRKVCHIAVTNLSLSLGDVLFHDLEVATNERMFFITRGGLDYKQEEKEAVQADKGKWLCEAVLWTTWTHCGTARANAETRMLVLEASKFQDIVSTFPSEHAAQYAAEYCELLNTLGPAQLTDLHIDNEAVDVLLDRVFPEECDLEDDDSDLDGDVIGDSSGLLGDAEQHPYCVPPNSPLPLEPSATRSPQISVSHCERFSDQRFSERCSTKSEVSRRSSVRSRRHDSDRSNRGSVGHILSKISSRLSARRNNHSVGSRHSSKSKGASATGSGKQKPKVAFFMTQLTRLKANSICAGESSTSSAGAGHKSLVPP